ncbi:MAG: flagella basal body P-ring formation protein FlgA [Acidobacteria bacterium]|nr:flagella basal body P-ring formation protein FlgA [Acidobacteriota bacterium]
MIRTSQLAIGICLLLGGSYSLRASTSMSSMLTARPIVEALHNAGVEAKAGEIEFVGSVPASDTDAVLRVTGWRKLNTGTVWVRLVCRRAQDCLPFFILLHPAEKGIVPSFSILPDSKTQSGSIRKTLSPSLIRAGSRATLLLKSGPASIRTSVICLESGERGASIRVRNVATKRILAAQIVGRGLVEARY